MIKDRPAHLLGQNDYKRLPSEPFAVDFAALPDLIRESFAPLGGIQPVTGAMATAANGQLRDTPAEGEVAMFREAGTEFQMISVIVSLAHLGKRDGVAVATPYALSLIPASKRGAVSHSLIDLVAKLDVQKIIEETEPCYAGLNPFTGDWSLNAPLSILIGDNPFNCFLDELGLVVGQYWLATKYNPNDVLEVPLGLPDGKAEEKYRKKRTKLLYAPFGKVVTRRIWGAESPIELFLFQELLRRGLSPSLQMQFYQDGSIHPSLYHLWRDVDFRHMPVLITESDMYFPDQRVAVFCDSNKHHARAAAKRKDKKVDASLEAHGVTSVRVPGPLILNDLKAAADLVMAALES